MMLELFAVAALYASAVSAPHHTHIITLQGQKSTGTSTMSLPAVQGCLVGLGWTMFLRLRVSHLA